MSSAQSSGKASGGQLEERVDLSTEAAEKISQATSLIETAKNNPSSLPSALQDALALLSALEKKCRVGNDTPSLVNVCRTMITLCREADGSDEKEVLHATLKQLSTRRSQKSKAIAVLVETVSPWLIAEDGYTPLDTSEFAVSRHDLLTTLRNISSGKMYLEAEYARITRCLTILAESAWRNGEEGKLNEAADLLGEVHVETYGSLSKREKVEFVLEQMRLNLMRKDYVRAHIVSNKIKKSTLEEEGMSTLKVKFYTLLASYYQQHDKNAFELAKCFHSIYGTCASIDDKKSDHDGDKMTDDAAMMEWKEALTNTVVFLCLSEYNNEVKDMMERIRLDPMLEKIAECRDTIKAFLKNEIIHYPLPHQSALESIPAFSTASLSVDLIIDKNQGQQPDETLRSHWHTTFHTRIIQHNLRIVSLYYRRIQLSRLSQLLSLSSAEAETHISQMVSSGSLYAKIDRPKDIVRFSKKRCEEEVLTDWAEDIKQLLGLVEETSYLIQKENMVQNH